MYNMVYFNYKYDKGKPRVIGGRKATGLRGETLDGKLKDLISRK